MTLKKTPLPSKPEKELECFNFLQRERNRLSKLNNLISNTLINIKRYSQISLLIIKEETTNQEKKDKIVQHALPMTSYVNSQLKKLFSEANSR